MEQKDKSFISNDRFFCSDELFYRGPGAKVLNACCAQTLYTMGTQCALPAKELLDRQAITIAGIFKGKKTTTHSSDHFGLATGNPATGICGGKIRNTQRTAIRANDKFGARSILFGHVTHY